MGRWICAKCDHGWGEQDTCWCGATKNGKPQKDLIVKAPIDTNVLSYPLKLGDQSQYDTWVNITKPAFVDVVNMLKWTFLPTDYIYSEQKDLIGVTPVITPMYTGSPGPPLLFKCCSTQGLLFVERKRIIDLLLLEHKSAGHYSGTSP